jgi:hypothetical protein
MIRMLVRGLRRACTATAADGPLDTCQRLAGLGHMAAQPGRIG